MADPINRKELREAMLGARHALELDFARKYDIILVPPAFEVDLVRTRALLDLAKLEGIIPDTHADDAERGPDDPVGTPA